MAEPVIQHEPNASTSTTTNSTPTSSTDPPLPPAPKPYILIVESNLINAKVLSRFIERRLGYPYHICTTGISALTLFKAACRHQTYPPLPSSNPTPPTETIFVGQVSFEVSTTKRPFTHIFINVALPEMDGFEATREIRKFEEENGLINCMIVGSGANVLRGTREKAMESGMDVFLGRPVGFREIRRCFDDALEWV